MNLRLFFQLISLLFFFVDGFAYFSKTTLEYSTFNSTFRNNSPQDTSSCRYKDSLALVSFFNALDGPNWDPSFRWDLTKPITTWKGLFGNSQGCVTSIFFETDDLNGAFPAAITQLSSLESLHLKCKNLEGSLPAEIGRLSKLTNLTIAGTKMTGIIPEEIGQLKNLKKIFLNANRLNGLIPSSIGNLTQLEVLNLSTNDSMRGDIPKSLLNLTKLRVLDLNSNQFTGTIPPNIDTLANLEQLLYLGNKMSGTLPKNLGKLSKLTVLDLAINPNLGGTIPKELGNLKNLVKFNISATAIEGSIPPELAQLDSLQFFFVAETKLNGDFPNLKSPKLQIIYSNNNQLDGQVPDLNLPGLLAWYLHNNKLKSLPKFSKLSSMGKGIHPGDSLTLYNNNLSFDDLVPNLDLINAMKGKVKYHPQDSVYKDTLIKVVSGSPLKINLLIDSTISDNKYTWTKNGQAYAALIQNNRLVFNSVQKSDAGTYFFKITNLRLPLLTLNGRRIKIEVLEDKTTCRYQDSLELVKLYNATGGEKWTKPWILTESMNTWYGVRLNDSGCVKCLELDGSPDCNIYQGLNTGNNLIGQLPSLNLQSLEVLDLSNNQLIGAIPNFNLPNLTELDLSYNGFNGNVPNFDLPNLSWLWLHRNGLVGTIPNFNLPSLKWLQLQNNNLSGNIPNFESLQNLEDLNISYNGLIGSIPNFKLKKLTLLFLTKNQLSGQVPDFSNTALRYFDAGDNDLESMANITLNTLTAIVLYNNKLKSVPNLKLPALIRLNLGYNLLEGSIPDFNTPALLELYLDNNNLSDLPKFTNLDSIYVNTTRLKEIKLEENQFTFEDIVPNINIIKQGKNSTYAPQDSFFIATTYQKKIGDTLTIDLLIDAQIKDNEYSWLKVGSTEVLKLNENKRFFNYLSLSDSGTYYVQVRNPQAPQLTLYSRRIRINVAAIGTLQTASINQTLCKGDSIRINFSSAIQYKSDNVFQVELSESATNFNAPTILGSIKSPTATKISLAIPNNFISQKDYFYRVVSTNPRVVSAVNPLKVKIEQALAAPVVKCGQATGNSIVFNWEGVPGATGYQISNNTTNNGIRNGNTVTFSNLQPNSKITLEVQPLGSNACPAVKDTQTCATLTCSEIVNSGQAIPTTLVCNSQNSPILLNDLLLNEDPKGTWSTQQLFAENVFDPDAGTFIPKDTKPGRYRFMYTVGGKNGCPSSSTTLNLDVEQKLGINISDYSNCLDAKGKTQITLANVAKRVSPKYPDQVRWFKDANKQTPLTQPVLELAAPLTIYTQVGQGNCASPVSPIVLKPNEKLNLPIIEGKLQIKVGDTIHLRTNQSYPPGSIFVWKTPDTTSLGTDQYRFPSRIASKVDEGRYTLVVRAPQEPRIPTCISDTAWVDLKVYDENDAILKIGKNVSDNTPWVIEGLNAYPSYKIKVFNRWGKLVFQADSNYLNQWLGTCEVNCNGGLLSQGTYYYFIEIPELDPIVGAVYVIR